MSSARSLAPAEDFSEANEGSRFEVGFLFVLGIPLAAALANVGDVAIAGLSYTGWLWASMLAIGIVLLQVHTAVAQGFRGCFPSRLWLVWLAYLWTSLVWCGGLGARNLQEAAQISMPVLAAILDGQQRIKQRVSRHGLAVHSEIDLVAVPGARK